jgi:stress response protein YsnF
MTRTVTALYDNLPEARDALQRLSADVALTGSEIVDADSEGMLALGGLQLSDQDRLACERSLDQGGYLLVAQVQSHDSADRIIALLEDYAGGWVATTADAAAATREAETAPASTEPIEERLPILEEEIRIGKREVVRGGARVHTYAAEVPVTEQVELLQEHVSIEGRTVNRILSEDDLQRGGLLQERVIEISEMREEAIVSKEAFVREELVVKKTIERRVEHVQETVRRTEVEMEELDRPETRSAFPALNRNENGTPVIGGSSPAV